MPAKFDRNAARSHLEHFALQSLFINELGWDHGGANTHATVGSQTFALHAVAHKRGMVVYQCVADSTATFPDHPTRQKIERIVARTVREHLIVYVTHDLNTQYWHWVKREPGRPDRTRTHIYSRGQSGEALLEKLEQLVITLDEEANVTLVNVTGRVRAAFDVEKVTKGFYDRFKKEHTAFLTFIDGITNVADREWYASLMLNRMMFIYFIQKRGFLDNDRDYLRNRLERVRRQQGNGNFHSFYRLFLLRLFHEGLGQPAAARAPELAALLGRVPYLNGGLFDVHDLERENPNIRIPDEAFEHVFAFFDAYQWHLDDRPLRNDNEINPDVLGYIFEKYINQKQMGAYYTKEDITGYISRNTVLPFLFDRTKQDCSIAFKPGGGVWRLLADDPDRYVYNAVRHGITYDVHKRETLTEQRELPSEIAAGLNDVAHRGGWNDAAPPEYALPTETWREHVARRQRYEDVRAKLAAGEVTLINDLITDNLDIEQFAVDVIAGSEGPELVRAFWKAMQSVSILDPTCGSGAFLFAALNVLEPLYTACLDAMRGFLDDLKHSKRKYRPEKLSDFRNVLHQVEAHASERYFVLKSIIIDNLYGVDIMEEAVEICKLRLFLKLVAQLDDYEQIEPLPDIDFNVRTGNTLVGFTSREQVKQALSSDLINQLSLPQIEERAEIADRAFRKFREMQTEHGMDARAFADAKLDLRKRLDDLRNELDEYLSGEYGVKTDDAVAYQQWRDSHQPFHWFVEFYGIMHQGGFDVIIGNPPYVEYSKVKDKTYTVKGYETESCGNLYAFVLERCKNISNSGALLSMIVPLSGHSTKRMTPLLNNFYRQFKSCYLFNISADAHPSILFPGVKFRLVIFIASNRGKGIFTTSYSRWYTEERSNLFSLLHYTNIGDMQYATAIPKASNRLHLKVLRKLVDASSSWRDSLSVKQASENRILYHSAPVHWIRAHTMTPYFHSQRDGEKTSTELNPIYFEKEQYPQSFQGIFCSTSFFLWWLSHSDCYHLNRPEIDMFPMFHDDELVLLSKQLESDMQTNSKRRVYHYRTTGRVEYDEFYMKMSKPIIDEIDRVLAKHYGFTDEELDFIINYDIKYRMGLGGQQT